MQHPRAPFSLPTGGSNPPRPAAPRASRGSHAALPSRAREEDATPNATRHPSQTGRHCVRLRPPVRPPSRWPKASTPSPSEGAPRCATPCHWQLWHNWRRLQGSLPTHPLPPLRQRMGHSWGRHPSSSLAAVPVRRLSHTGMLPAKSSCLQPLWTGAQCGESWANSTEGPAHPPMSTSAGPPPRMWKSMVRWSSNYLRPRKMARECWMQMSTHVSTTKPPRSWSTALVSTMQSISGSMLPPPASSLSTVSVSWPAL
mmetsp:Transcript_62184/g.201650  ORF Transcript_62184/g.201650 Transcript_62184/m.201650 type:complete len:256 (-) Transcript_62184:401-1168(-)